MIINRKRFSLKKMWPSIVQRCVIPSRFIQPGFIKQLFLSLMRMWRFLLLLSSITLFASACTEGDAVDGSKMAEDNSLLIAKALYFDKRTPDDFYHEESSDNLFTSISHVKNIGILPMDNRTGLSVYELSSNDFVEAMAWDEQATIYQPLYSQLVDNTETELYYQFTRVNPDLPEFVDISRVFKAATLDRSGVDRNDDEGEYQGKIMLTDISSTNVKQVVEYLWMFSFSNNYSNAVLESYTTETADEFIHIMKQAEINFSYNDNCDAIELYEVRYSVAKESGLIWRDKILMDTFSAKRSGVSVDICQ